MYRQCLIYKDFYTAERPVIMCEGETDGAPKIRRAVEQAAKIKLKGTEPYVHVVRNMYAMPTPLLNGDQQSKIEHFFDAITKATVLGGKTFNDRKKFDITKHYGKRIFAEQVVKSMPNSINFVGFQPLLTVLQEIIRDHTAAQFPGIRGLMRHGY